MADYKVVDAEQLDADLTSVANKIRERSGTEESLKFPNGYERDIDNIPVAKEEQEKTLTVTKNGSYKVLPDENKVLSGVNVNVDVQDKNVDNALLVFTDYDNEGFPSTLIYNCPDTATLPSLFYNSNSSSGQISSRIKKVIMPDTVTTISNRTFCGISGLEEVSNWDKLTYIGDSAFDVNNNTFDKGLHLRYTYLPPNLTYIGKLAFFRNLKLSSNIPDTVTYIGDSAFQYGGGVNWEITKLPPNLTYIGNNAFHGYRKLLITEIPAKVETIGSGAFNGAYDKNSLKLLKFMGTPTSIGSDAFVNNTALVDIYVPWAEGEVDNAPWGAINATIHYNTLYDEDGEPITA